MGDITERIRKCPHGHLLTREAIYVAPGGAQSCLRCRRERSAAANAVNSSIRLNLSPVTRKRLQSIRDRTEATSYAQVVREALRHYEAFLNEIRATAGRITSQAQQ